MSQFYNGQKTLYTVSFILKSWNILGPVPYQTFNAKFVMTRSSLVCMENLGQDIGHIFCNTAEN